MGDTMEIICIEKVSAKGLKETNEDSLYCDSKIAFVIDGASSLIKLNGLPSARWIVDKFMKYIIESYEYSNNLKQLIRKILKQLKIDYIKEYNLPEDRVYWPSASASIIIVRKNYLEYIVLGDAPLILYPKEGEPLIIRDKKLIELDKKVISFIYRNILKGMKFSEAYKKSLPLLITHRRKVCKPNGYSAISLDESCINYSQYGKIEIDKLKYIIMSTDGFIRIVDVFKYVEDYNKLLKEALTKGLAYLLVKLRELEYKDIECLLYPRLSISDDATAMLLKLKNY